MESSRLTGLLLPQGPLGDARPLPPTQALFVIKSLLNALHYCHEQGVVVRDVTPSNVMVRCLDGGSLDVMLADLSAAVETGCKDDLLAHPLYQAHRQESPCASLDDLSGDSGEQYYIGAPLLDCNNVALYLPPECSRSNSGCDSGLGASPSMDMWALGILAHLLFTAQLPDTSQENWQAELPHVQHLPRARDFIMAFLQSRPEQRLTSQQALRHAFILLGT